MKAYSPAWGEGMGEDVSEKENFEELGFTQRHISDDAFSQTSGKPEHC